MTPLLSWIRKYAGWIVAAFLGLVLIVRQWIKQVPGGNGAPSVEEEKNKIINDTGSKEREVDVAVAKEKEVIEQRAAEEHATLVSTVTKDTEERVGGDAVNSYLIDVGAEMRSSDRPTLP